MLASCSEPDTGPPAAPAQPAPAAPTEIEALRALGYVDVAEADPGLPVGVLWRDPARSDTDLTYLTSSHTCSSQLQTASGEVLRRWSHAPCFRWDNTLLLPSGEVLAIHRYPGAATSETAVEARALLKLGADGALLWERRLPLHHDLEITPDGRIATLLIRPRRIPEIHPTAVIKDHAVALLSPEGELLEEVSLTDVLRSAPELFTLRPVRPQVHGGVQEIDLLHSNSVEFMRRPELAARDPLYAPGNVLVCIRHQDAVVIFDWKQRRLLWAWGPGEILGPHDATVLPDGHLLLFDNGLGRGWSRVVELDPIAKTVVWEYKDPDPARFYTLSRGAAQRLRTGNTLVTNSGSGMIFEVTPSGEKVFEYRNTERSDDRRPSVIVRARRLRELGAGPERFEVSD